MDFYKSALYKSDLDQTLQTVSGLMKEYEGCSIFVTGSTGLIGSAIVDLLLRYGEQQDRGIQVYAAGRIKERVLSRFSRYAASKYLHEVEYDASRKNTLGFRADYIIHGAGNACPAAIWKLPVETMLGNIFGMYELLEYASQKDVKNTLFLSSSEVYGRKEDIRPYLEDEYGFVDLLTPRSSYSVSKRAAETLCVSYYYERGTPVSMVRPGHIYGPTASRADNRVSSSFAFDVADGKDIVLKSEGSQIRSYCYVLDCATAILTVLAKGKQGEAYNISNPASVLSIRELAERYARYGKVHLQFDLPSDAEKAAFNPMENSSLNSDKLLALGWRGIFDASMGTAHTIQIIRESGGMEIKCKNEQKGFL